MYLNVIDSVKDLDISEALFGTRCACMIFFNYIVETYRTLLGKR